MFYMHLALRRRLQWSPVMLASRAVLLLFLLTQAGDGLLTYTAVRSYGIAAEGNMVLATWMVLVGPATTLVAAKQLAAAAEFSCMSGGCTASLPG